MPLRSHFALALLLASPLAAHTQAMSPADRAALRTALAAYDQGNASAAEPTLRTLATRYPKQFDLNEALGSLYAESSDPQRALPYLQRAASAAPTQPLAHANLGATYLKLSRPTEAIPELQLAARQDPTNPSTQANLGQALLLTKQPALAAKAFAAASASNPSDLDLQYNHALALYDSADYRASAAILNAIPPASATPEIHALAGDANEHAGDFAKALAHYEAAAQASPTDPNLFALTAELLRHWNWPEAIKVADYASTRYPASEHFRLAAGVAYYAKSDYPSAVTIFAALLQSNANNALAADLLGRSCSALVDGENTGCSVVLDFAQRHPGNAVMSTYAAVAILHASQNQQNLDQAATLLTAAIAADPKYAEAYLRMGVLEQTRQHWTESVKFLEQSIALNPTAPEAHYRLSRAYAHLGRNEDARAQVALHQTYSQKAKDQLDGKLQEVMRFILNPS